MKSLGNKNGGLSSSAMRGLYTGMVRPIFTWGAEVWRDTTPKISAYKKLEYQALRKITGAYHGAAHTKLGLIANVEPIEDKLRDLELAGQQKPSARGILSSGTSSPTLS